MGLSREAFKRMMIRLLPRGVAWAAEPGTNLGALLEATAEEHARLEARGNDLLRELDPYLTAELLSDWERLLGLPDPCIEGTQTLAQRRAQVVYKLTTNGGQSRQFYIDLAAILGFEVTITEFHAFRAGISHAGDPDYGVSWLFAWRVTAPANTTQYFRAGANAAGDPLAAWGNEALECTIERLAPAHTFVHFAYA